MATEKRIDINKYLFGRLISEVDGLCPLCSERLITLDGTRQANLSQAAHIYPHSPTEAERTLLRDVPRLSENTESYENLIMLCPTCHLKFDNPRTVEKYMGVYNLKKILLRRQEGNAYYKKHNIEEDLLAVLKSIGGVDITDEERKLSYKAMTVKDKMSGKASEAIQQIVIRDVRDYYLPISDALIQLEYDSPGKSELIAKEVALFHDELKVNGFSQDEIYYAINDWLDNKTLRQYTHLTPFITAFYIQNCEVFSL